MFKKTHSFPEKKQRIPKEHRSKSTCNSPASTATVHENHPANFVERKLRTKKFDTRDRETKRETRKQQECAAKTRKTTLIKL